jgi:hypothetical protein
VNLRPRPAARRCGWWLLAAMVPPWLVVVTMPPWTSWGAAQRPLYLTCMLAGHLLAVAACVVGRLQNRSAGRRAWTMTATAIAAVTVLLAMEELLPPEALDTGVSGVVYMGTSALLALAVLAIPLLLVRARLNKARDREGLVDAIAIAVAVGLALWDVLVLTGTVEQSDVVGTMLTAAAGASATALMARLSFTGVGRALRAASAGGRCNDDGDHAAVRVRSIAGCAGRRAGRERC